MVFNEKKNGTKQKQKQKQKAYQQPTNQPINTKPKHNQKTTKQFISVFKDYWYTKLKYTVQFY